MTPAFIAGDWGTTRLRLSLCDAVGAVLGAREGPGVAKLERKLDAPFLALTAEWDAAHGALPAILCGMAGSTLGWREVPYLPCPIHPEKIAAGALIFEAAGRRIAIAPGLSCRNRLDAPDVMRGEETQILGALRLDPALADDTQLLCLPGTHTKWVLLRGGAIVQFQTGVAGEAFDILRHHSVLVGPSAPVAASTAFQRALEQVARFPDADLLHLLFETRSRQLAGELKPQEAAEYLSGLVVGRDVAGALRLFPDAGRVTLVGAEDLCARYAQALGTQDRRTAQVEGAAASLAGLTALHDALFREGIAHVS
jgi:2-dehydro-3-deoxygalactonokinase